MFELAQEEVAGEMSVNRFVHCHLCVLKDLCSVQASDDSYNFHRDPEGRSWDLGKLQMATTNCPIKRKVLH